MIKNKHGQVSTLITILITVIIVIGFAVYKIFAKQDKDVLAKELEFEAKEVYSRIDTLFKDKNFCNYNLSFKKRDESLFELKRDISGEEKIYFTRGQKINRLKLHQLKLELDSEEKNETTLNLLIELSNFEDENSKLQLGMKEFKYSIPIRVNDCPTILLRDSENPRLVKSCIAPIPDGINGELVKNLTENIKEAPEHLIECRVCYGKPRNMIYNCL